jgi:hypothetical protein
VPDDLTRADLLALAALLRPGARGDRGVRGRRGRDGRDGTTEAARWAPFTRWFVPIDPTGATVAPVPGTPDAAAMSFHTPIRIQVPTVLEAAHNHQTLQGIGGSTDYELFRRRSGVFALIATSSLAGGGADFALAAFAILDTSTLQDGDYLYLQLTSKQTGTSRGAVDVHMMR